MAMVCQTHSIIITAPPSVVWAGFNVLALFSALVLPKDLAPLARFPCHLSK